MSVKCSLIRDVNIDWFSAFKWFVHEKIDISFDSL